MPLGILPLLLLAVRSCTEDPVLTVTTHTSSSTPKTHRIMVQPLLRIAPSHPIVVHGVCGGGAPGSRIASTTRWSRSGIQDNTSASCAQVPGAVALYAPDFPARRAFNTGLDAFAATGTAIAFIADASGDVYLMLTHSASHNEAAAGHCALSVTLLGDSAQPVPGSNPWVVRDDPSDAYAWDPVARVANATHRWGAVDRRDGAVLGPLNGVSGVVDVRIDIVGPCGETPSAGLFPTALISANASGGAVRLPVSGTSFRAVAQSCASACAARNGACGLCRMAAECAWCSGSCVPRTAAPAACAAAAAAAAPACCSECAALMSCTACFAVAGCGWRLPPGGGGVAACVSGSNYGSCLDASGGGATPAWWSGAQRGANEDPIDLLWHSSACTAFDSITSAPSAAPSAGPTPLPTPHPTPLPTGLPTQIMRPLCSSNASTALVPAPLPVGTTVRVLGSSSGAGGGGASIVALPLLWQIPDAATVSGGGASVPSKGALTFNVAKSFAIAALELRITGLQHERAGDVAIYLRGPSSAASGDGVAIFGAAANSNVESCATTKFGRSASGSRGATYTWLSRGGSSLPCTCRGCYLPQVLASSSALRSFHGTTSAGAWVLTVSDVAPGDVGFISGAVLVLTRADGGQLRVEPELSLKLADMPARGVLSAVNATRYEGPQSTLVDGDVLLGTSMQYVADAADPAASVASPLQLSYRAVSSACMTPMDSTVTLIVDDSAAPANPAVPATIASISDSSLMVSWTAASASALTRVWMQSGADVAWRPFSQLYDAGVTEVTLVGLKPLTTYSVWLQSVSSSDDAFAGAPPPTDAVSASAHVSVATCNTSCVSCAPGATASAPGSCTVCSATSVLAPSTGECFKIDTCGANTYRVCNLTTTSDGILCESYKCMACEGCSPGSIRTDCGGYSDGSCRTCPAGRYKQDETTCIECMECPAQTFASAMCTASTNTVCKTCESGATSPVGSTSSFACTCGLGTYKDSIGRCIACSSGCDVCNDYACLRCDATHFLIPKTATCVTQCPEGERYEVVTAGGVATAKYPVRRCVSCQSCVPGEYRTGCAGASGGICASCAAGRFKPHASPVGVFGDNCTACKQASKGIYIAKACTAVKNAELGNCAVCPAGSMRTGCLNASAGICIPCPAGSFKSVVGAWNMGCRKCYACPVGRFGLTECTTKTDAGACGTCRRCGHLHLKQTDTFQLVSESLEYIQLPCSNTENADTLCGACGSCAAGKYRFGCQWNKTATGACVTCESGKFKSLKGSADARCSTCGTCPSGKYVDQDCIPGSDRKCFTCPSPNGNKCAICDKETCFACAGDLVLGMDGKCVEACAVADGEWRDVVPTLGTHYSQNYLKLNASVCKVCSECDSRYQDLVAQCSAASDTACMVRNATKLVPLPPYKEDFLVALVNHPSFISVAVLVAVTFVLIMLASALIGGIHAFFHMREAQKNNFAEGTIVDDEWVNEAIGANQRREAKLKFAHKEQWKREGRRRRPSILLANDTGPIKSSKAKASGVKQVEMQHSFNPMHAAKAKGNLPRADMMNPMHQLSSGLPRAGPSQRAPPAVAAAARFTAHNALPQRVSSASQERAAVAAPTLVAPAPAHQQFVPHFAMDESSSFDDEGSF